MGPKMKLMVGNITYSKEIDEDNEREKFEFKDKKGNFIKVYIEEHEITCIEYIPFKQFYPSTYTQNKRKLNKNKLQIRIHFMFPYTGKIYFGRESNIDKCRKNNEKYLASYNPEIKEFLSLKGREHWWSPDLTADNNEGSALAFKEFEKEMYKFLTTRKVTAKVWDLISTMKGYKDINMNNSSDQEMKGKDLEIDLTLFPKEVLFVILLYICPSQMQDIRLSKNNKIQSVISSGLFREAYKKRYPKKFLSGKIKHERDSDRDSVHIFTDDKGNRVILEETKGVFTLMEYKPFRQNFPSTYLKEDQDYDFELNELNPLQIYISSDDGTKPEGHAGRLDFGNVNEDFEEEFLSLYNSEVKEFFNYIEKDHWWNKNISWGNSELSEKIMTDFYIEIYRCLKDVNMEKMISEIIGNTFLCGKNISFYSDDII